MPDPAPHNAEPIADNAADNPDMSALRAHLTDAILTRRRWIQLPLFLTGGGWIVLVFLVFLYCIKTHVLPNAEAARVMVGYPLLAATVLLPPAFGLEHRTCRAWLSSRTRAATMCLTAASLMASAGTIVGWILVHIVLQ